MCNGKGFIRRMLPFFATFAIGLFIASFFVSVGRPGFRTRGWERHRQNERLRIENEELRNENLRLKNLLENQNWAPSSLPRVNSEEWVNRGPEFPVEGPPPPPMPVAPKAKR